jgi:hypothetical protein
LRLFRLLEKHMSLLSILVTKVRDWTPHREEPVMAKSARVVAETEAEAAPEAFNWRAGRDFTPAYCTKLGECGSPNAMRDWA